MKRLAVVLTLLCAGTALAAGTTVRRFALLIGANDGGPERMRLRYAVTDAERLAQVLNELGGLDPSDMQLLEEGRREDVLRALDVLAQRLQQAKAAGVRTEAIVYYSGHSDEEGLLLGGERVAYSELRAALEKLPADVRIAVLDSCASGTMARKKGGVRRAPFLVDASTTVRGQAILTSSSGDEASQESDGLGGSYFTHHLVSGLRGAADASRDGRVTLSEAYQFAFSETLARTGSSRAGPQHPSWDIDLVGSGDVVLTDLRSTTAGLRFASGLDGRLFVRDEKENLVAEIHKAKGELAELAVPPGTYSVLRTEGGSRWSASVTVAAGGRADVAPDAFRALPAELTVSRGGGVPSRFFNLSLVPFAATNDVVARSVDNNLSIGVIAARSGALNGVALSSALNLVDRETNGVLLSGGANIGGGPVTGVQLAAAFNYAPQVLGWQSAGGVNVAGAVRGLQLAVVNVGGEVEGAQVGVINVGAKVKGLQLGVINVGSEVSGASVGLFSFVRDGQFHVEAWSSDAAWANVGVKLGSKYVYTLFAVSAAPTPKDSGRAFGAGAGLGGHVPFERWFLDVDALANTQYTATSFDSSLTMFQLRAMAGLNIAGRFSVIAGPSFNVAVDLAQKEVATLTRLPTWGTERVRYWPGVQAGLRY